MAGARPSGFKQGGGGFLNNVDGVIAGYEWTSERPGNGEGRASKKSDFVPLYFRLAARPDGAEEDLETSLFAGGAEDFEIEDDGKTLVPHDDDGGLRANADVSVFINSLVEAGFPETNLPEDKINYEAIIGTRVRFGQMAKLDKTGKPMMRTAKQGKFKGKEFPVTFTVITKVYDLPGKGAAKKGAAASTAKGKTKPAPEPENDDVAEVAGDVVRAILSGAPGGKIAKAKLNVAVLQKMLKHKRKDLKDAVREWLQDDENLISIDDVAYDTDSETLEA